LLFGLVTRICLEILKIRFILGTELNN